MGHCDPPVRVCNFSSKKPSGHPELLKPLWCKYCLSATLAFAPGSSIGMSQVRGSLLRFTHKARRPHSWMSTNPHAGPAKWALLSPKQGGVSLSHFQFSLCTSLQELFSQPVINHPTKQSGSCKTPSVANKIRNRYQISPLKVLPPFFSL